MKEKVQFYCNTCGYTASKWFGKCPDCNSWGSFTEELQISSGKKRNHYAFQKVHNKPVMLRDIQTATIQRWKTQIDEFDRTIGGGIMSGSLILIGGDPGIGKSTLMLHIAASLSHEKKI